MNNKVIEFAQECFKLGQIPSSANITYIVLIPKVAQATNFNHFPSISLCNFLYKIVAKIIAGRLNKVIGRIISFNQGGFVKGRWIAENTVVDQESVYKVKKNKGKEGLMTIKVYMKKAYDRM